ncbi:MAG: MOSC domain-containing protein [Polyangiaceae bacterium]
MRTRVGHVESLFRYPVKSMGREDLEAIELGWHGLAGDRRLALRRLNDRRGFPWLQASSLRELILFTPLRRGPSAHDLPTHVRTPDGEELEVFGAPLAEEIERRYGAPVEMVHLDRGIFDEASVSVITSTTVRAASDLGAQRPDVRRYRPNILIASSADTPFEEDSWVGGVLTFGPSDEGASVFVTNRDERCSMVNLDPDTAAPAPQLLKAIVQERDNKAGVYGAVARRGRISVGDPVYVERATGASR